MESGLSKITREITVLHISMFYNQLSSLYITKYNTWAFEISVKFTPFSVVECISGNETKVRESIHIGRS